MTLETINNLKILAEEVMITALADYDYYTKNGEVVPAIDIFDTITNVWIKDKSHSAGRHITAEEVLSARVNPTGAVLSDFPDQFRLLLSAGVQKQHHPRGPETLSDFRL